MATPATPRGEQSWIALQRKIFTRWVNQKLSLAGPKDRISDVVTDLADGVFLVKLVEILSDKPFSGKKLTPQKMKLQRIDNCSRALEYVFTVGIEMQLKPSPENLVDGDEKQILGLVWAIMKRFIKFGHGEEGEEQKLGAEDSLLQWVNNQVREFKLPPLKDFGPAFQDGLALCALIYKFRPKLLPDFPRLDKSDADGNLKKAFLAAEKYFGLEQYLSVAEFHKLDPKSLFIYISEFYTGIAEQRKMDLAARRIGKLISYTETNDQLRDDYAAKAASLREKLNKATALLNDRTITNTMEGAKRKIQEFYEYKKTEKNQIVSLFLSLETLFNHLATRLSEHSRPAFNPKQGLSIPDLRKELAALEVTEQQRQVALNAELNRQIRISQLSGQHGARFEKLQAWLAQKHTQLAERQKIESSGAAEFQLNLLKGFRAEQAIIEKSSVAELKKLGAGLAKEQYEKIADVKAREKSIDDGLAKCVTLATSRQEFLEDALAREKTREQVELWDAEHVAKRAKLKQWYTDKRTYLESQEQVASVSDAQLHLSLLAAYEQDFADVQQTRLPALTAIGQQILTAKHQTPLSTYVFPTPAAVTGREQEVQEEMKTLAAIAVVRKARLDDHLEREEYRAKVLLLRDQHVAKAKDLMAWAAEKKVFLAKKEEANNIPDARLHLSLLDAYDNEALTMGTATLKTFEKIGAQTLGSKYEKKSTWLFDSEEQNPGEGPALRAREKAFKDALAELSDMSRAKRNVLNEDLKRELEKERLRLLFANLAAEFVRWCKASADEVASTHFGFQLQEIEAARQLLDVSAMELGDKSKDDLAECSKCFEEGKAIGVTDNVYTELTPASLSESQAVLQTALKQREERYTHELEEARKKDKMCQNFAAAVKPFLAMIARARDELTASHEDLDKQLKKVDAKIGTAKADSAPLQQIKDLQAQLDAAGVTQNPHIGVNAMDVEVQWRQYEEFLKGKRDQLVHEIEHQKMRGMTQEQFQEIQDQFAQFDFNKNKKLDKNEFTACLYSLGEDKQGKEIRAILQKFGTKTEKDSYVMEFDQFKEFMCQYWGDSDTESEIIKSFELLAKGGPATPLALGLLLADKFVAYLQKNSKADKKGGLDVAAWTHAAFQR